MILLKRVLLLCMSGLFLVGPSAVGATQQEMRDPELLALHARGCSVYHGQHDRDGGMKLFKELEALAAGKHNNYWEASALWKQAQVLSDDGDQAQCIALFERSLAIFSRDSDFAGTANHLLLLGNLFADYESRGQRGESLRIHRAMIPATGLNLARTSKLPADTPLFDLTDEQLKQVGNMAFIGVLYSAEIRLRFESGNDADALALAEKIDRRFSGTTRPCEVTIYAPVLESLVRLHLCAGRMAEAERTLMRLIALKEVPHSEAYDEVLGARVDLDLLRCREGADPAPLLADARGAVEEMRSHRWIERRLIGTGQIARMHAFAGDFAEGKRLIDASIAETRTLDEPKLLAELLLARAEIQLDAEALGGVKADLYETLKWYRQQGGLRAEAGAYVQYVRFLRVSGQWTAARKALARAEACLRRFPDALQRAVLDREGVALGAMRDDGPPDPVIVHPVISDLQPVQLTTCVSDQWSAKGRFTLTNPGRAVVDGWMVAGGVGLESTWDEARLQWRVDARPAGTHLNVKQHIVLQPLDQATIVLTVDPAIADAGHIQLTWHGEGEDQSAWWSFSRGRVDSEIAVIDANLALGNPFYSVPLHHYIVRANPDAGTSQNLRVVTSAPCRVELVDAASGKVIAVDATGDGDFRGVGDVIFADGNLDGCPDLRFDKNQRVATLEIQVYPSSPGHEIDVRLELQKRDGSWASSATDRLLGKRE